MPEVLILTEADCERAVGRDAAFAAVEAVFAAMARGRARNFPVVREALGHADALYGFKSGFDRDGGALGVKSGGYWPGNADRGLTNHQSTVCLFDPDTGQLSALVAGNYLTAVRTAASSAVSIAHLARREARVLGIVGAGHQSAYQLRAAAAVRPFERVVAWNQSPARLDRLAAVAAELDLAFDAVDREALCAQADVIVTITSAFEPLLSADWIRPGTHLACMGTDTVGKQEVDPALFARARVFTDEPAQSATLGEAQHAVADGRIAADALIPIGAVIAGEAPGRSDADEITLFDGTGVGLQDLAAAQVAVRVARDQGFGQAVTL
ncbi:ornithine cyclodeaminase family protein [Rhodobacteraceae bacterium CCMM004]|nr:ornithine cyclodeaminase family protein [Rhodobacteraceae bacterium CCMM004]